VPAKKPNERTVAVDAVEGVNLRAG